MKNFIHNIDINSKTTNFKKGTILQRAGNIKTLTFYVKKGLLRSSIINNKDKEHVFMFAPETWIIEDVEALEFEEPAQLFIDCLEDTVAISFDKKDIFKSSLTSKQIIENIQLFYNTKF